MKLFKILLSVILVASFLVCPVEAKTPWRSKPPIGSQIDYSHPLAKGLVGCWLMNEGGGKSVRDLARNMNGTLVGDTKFTVNNIGSCLLFDGTGDYANSNSFVDTTQLTISVWLSTPAPTTSYMMILTKSSGVVGQPWELRFSANSGRIQFWSTTTVEGTDKGATALSANKLYHIVLTYNKVKAQIYINSIAETMSNDVSYASGSLITSSTTPILIGARKITTPEYFFNGSMKNCYLYNRALSSQEIQQLYIDPYCFIKPQTDWNCIKAVTTAVRRIFTVF